MTNWKQNVKPTLKFAIIVARLIDNYSFVAKFVFLGYSLCRSSVSLAAPALRQPAVVERLKYFRFNSPGITRVQATRETIHHVRLSTNYL